VSAERSVNTTSTTSVEVLGVRIDALSVSDLHRDIVQYVTTGAHALVLNVNAHCLNLAFSSSWLRDFLNQADRVFCDGAGVRLAARILGANIPERITYADWTWQLAELCALWQFTLFFLGGRPGVAAEAAERIRDRVPSVRIVGTHDGYFDKSPTGAENARVLAAINAVRPDILIVGFGMPLQEAWLRDNWDKLTAHVALTGGAVFDYLSGRLRRAPKWMTNNGLEWLGRLIVEPRRLWRRYLLGNPMFLARVAMQCTATLNFLGLRAPRE
jgi:N-acetylglucosaminyldiphosphoundecaprenol N-acetyl-beta-D-mannosaminyltransferase